MSKTFLGSSIDEFNFPDGQPHIKVTNFDKFVTCRIASSDDLVKVCMLLYIYRREQKSIDLTILYMMGERMDRAISSNEPNSCEVICDMLNSQIATFKEVSCAAKISITLLSPHSEVAPSCLGLGSKRPKDEMLTESVFYDMAIKNFLLFTGVSQQEIEYRQSKFSIVLPDKGALARISETPIMRWWPDANLVVMEKVREITTGKITGIKIASGELSSLCIILDDLCDGGATFVGASKELRVSCSSGDKKIGLAVVKGVFSKGTKLEGIDFIATTNSYQELESRPDFYVYRFM